MWTLIILALITLIVAVVVFLNCNDWFEGSLLVVLILIIGFLFSMILLPITSGLFPNYGKGERVGYIVNTSTEGIIWKTNEIQMQTGTGNIASVEGTYSFSVSSEIVFREIEKLRGSSQKVKVKYNRWFIMPYRLGWTNYNITNIEIQK